MVDGLLIDLIIVVLFGAALVLAPDDAPANAPLRALLLTVSRYRSGYSTF